MDKFRNFLAVLASPAAFPVTTSRVMAAAPRDSLKMPPPRRIATVLLDTRLSSMVSVPALSIPPPKRAELPSTWLSLIVRVLET